MSITDWMAIAAFALALFNSWLIFFKPRPKHSVTEEPFELRARADQFTAVYPYCAAGKNVLHGSKVRLH